MAKGVMFDKDSAVQIADGIRRIGSTPYGSLMMARPHKSRGGSVASDYNGPWAIIQKDATTVTVKAQDLANGYLCKSLVIAGLTTQEHATDADVTISASGVIYADITQSAGVYSIAFGNAASLPSQTSTHYFVPLAWVLFENGTIAQLVQDRHQSIEVTGRIV